MLSLHLKLFQTGTVLLGQIYDYKDLIKRKQLQKVISVSRGYFQSAAFIPWLMKKSQRNPMNF